MNLFWADPVELVVVDTDVQGIRYRSVYPNGEDCDDVPCRTADVQL